MSDYDPIEAGYATAGKLRLEDQLDAMLEQRQRAEAAGLAEADRVTRDAARRYELEPLTHHRAELAIRLALRGPVDRVIAGLRHGGYVRAAEDLRAALRLAAIVALELVERDRPSAEANLERVRHVCARLLAGDHRDRAAAEAILAAIR